MLFIEQKLYIVFDTPTTTLLLPKINLRKTQQNKQTLTVLLDAYNQRITCDFSSFSKKCV